MPLTTNVELLEIDGIVNRLFANLFTIASAHVAGADLRYTLSTFLTNYRFLIKDGTFGARLLACFTAARVAKGKLADFVTVRQGLFAETPIGPTSSAIVQMAIVFCLTSESRIITGITFVSRDDVDIMMTRMKVAFDTAREMAADSPDTSSYQSLTFLAGALINHLATVARPLPRMISFSLPVNYPALTLSNLIYYDPDRWEEILLENKIVNPAFCPRDIIGLSA